MKAENNQDGTSGINNQDNLFIEGKILINGIPDQCRNQAYLAIPSPFKFAQHVYFFSIAGTFKGAHYR